MRARGFLTRGGGRGRHVGEKILEESDLVIRGREGIGVSATERKQEENTRRGNYLEERENEVNSDCADDHARRWGGGGGGALSDYKARERDYDSSHACIMRCNTRMDPARTSTSLYAPSFH